MEKDGITRIFMTRNVQSPRDIYEVYPHYALSLTDEGLEGEIDENEGQAVIDSIDASCTSIQIGDSQKPGHVERKWIVHAKEGEIFELVKGGRSPEDYAALALTLEQRLGKVGLTIALE